MYCSTVSNVYQCLATHTQVAVLFRVNVIFAFCSHLKHFSVNAMRHCVQQLAWLIKENVHTCRDAYMHEYNVLKRDLKAAVKSGTVCMCLWMSVFVFV